MRLQDYEALYFQLFNRISDLILELQKLQQQAEEVYICRDDAPRPSVPVDNVLCFRPQRRDYRRWDKPNEPANNC